MVLGIGGNILLGNVTSSPSIVSSFMSSSSRSALFLRILQEYLSNVMVEYLHNSHSPLEDFDVAL